MDLQAIRVAVEAVARAAGEAVMQYYEQPHHETTKSNIYDVVTEGDRASEAVIVRALRDRFRSIPLSARRAAVGMTTPPPSMPGTSIRSMARPISPITSPSSRSASRLPPAT